MYTIEVANEIIQVSARNGHIIASTARVLSACHESKKTEKGTSGPVELSRLRM